MPKNSKFTQILQKIKNFFLNKKFHIAIGILLLLSSFFLFGSLFSFILYGGEDYNLWDLSLNQISEESKEFNNWMGFVGVQISNTIINHWFGIITLFWPWFLFRAGLQIIHPFNQYKFPKQLITLFFITIWGSIACAFFIPTIDIFPYLKLGGNHGNEAVEYLSRLVGNLGLGSIIIISIILFMIDPIIRWTKRITAYIKERRERHLNRNIINPNLADDFEIIEVNDNDNNKETTEDIIDLEDNLEDNTTNEEDITEGPIEDTTSDDIPLVIIPEQTEEEKTSADDSTPSNEVENLDFKVTIAEGEGSQIVEQVEDYDPTLDLSHYKYPSYDLLKDFGEIKSVDAIEQQENKERITQTLKNYGITIKKIEATVGPTITLYEIVPDDGIRISKIRNLGDDIALSLAAIGIRIIAPIPGRGTVGIEVPNKNPQIVPMRSLIASEKFQNTNFDLPIAIGKTITNEVFMLDLCKLPHLLVAGATGQGKSVGLNAIITSLLYKKHPSQLKIVLIDPKKTEFTLYSTIEKHFLAKLEDSEDAVISDVTKVTQTLQSVCKEMDTRFDLLKKAHVRNIKEYNEKFTSRQLNPEKGHRYLPYMVVIIDEFADLIMTAGKEVEMPIARIAQLARAAGIHMIIATQRPSTNIITGSIKANFPGRLAFKVSSMVDSRTILDAPGAHQLVGRGDLLFTQGNNLTRVQCAFVDTPEVEAICNFISDQQGYTHAFYLPEVEMGDGESAIRGLDMSQRDPMFEDAARLVIFNQSGSTSMIQRKFSIGYNRAGRIMDQLEAAGIVGPQDGSKGRQVLVMDEAQLERILETLL